MNPDRCEMIIWWSVEDAAYVVDVPELPGCMAHGSTRHAAIKNAEEAIKFWINTAKDDRLEIPAPRGRFGLCLKRSETMFINGIYHQEYAKLEYGRMLWRMPASRECLLRHWKDPRHPHADRFTEHEAEVRRILESPKGSDAELDAELRQRGLSLRVVVKEIPSVFGSFY